MFKNLTQDACKGNGSVIGSSWFVTLLYMGETLAEFHISGTAQDSMERSNRTFRIGTNSDLNSCNMTGLILSGPVAFLGLRFFRSFRKPASEKLISVLTGVEFLRSPGSSVGGMTLSLTRSCTFISERSRKETGDRGVDTDWNCWFKISTFSLVLVHSCLGYTLLISHDFFRYWKSFLPATWPGDASFLCSRPFLSSR